jgi:hypothetical protein
MKNRMLAAVSAVVLAGAAALVTAGPAAAEWLR